MSDITTLMMAAAGAGGEAPVYEISRSLRLNSADSAYLSRTPAGAGNRKTFTFSAWAKFTKFGARQIIFGTGDASLNNSFEIEHYNDDKIRIVDFTTSVQLDLRTTAVYRDPSAWLNLIVVVDTTQATNTNRVKLYVNGEQVTSFSTATYPSQNLDTQLNTTNAHGIGRAGTYNSLYFNGYLTEIHFVDGQALAPTDFGKTNATTGAWEPKEYTGTYGTNGFYLDFSDNTSTTTIGYDAAGSNDWTANNFSVAAGAGNDSLVDTPTLYGTDTGAGGEVRANYATINPLQLGSTGTSNTLSNGNLENSSNRTADNNWAIANIALPTSGKWYCEVSGFQSSNGAGVGLIDITTRPSVGLPTNYRIYYGGTGVTYTTGLVSASYGASFATTDVIGIAVDVDAGTLVFYKNGVSQGTAFSDIVSSGVTWSFGVMYLGYTTNTSVWNFGQRSFAHAAPSGYKALCTTNLAEGTITTSGTFTGNGSTNGPFVYLNGVPTAMTIDGNAVTFGTHADKLANGFKVRSSSASYNANATSMSYTISTTGAKFKYANAQPNP